jgi:hypothetical protein
MALNKNKNVALKIALATLLAYAVLPFAVQAATPTSRSLTLGNSAGAAVTTYAFSFKPGTSGNIGAIKLQLCDSPLEGLGCVNTGDSSGASFTSNSATLSGQTGISGFSLGTGTPPAPTTNTLFITNGTPQNINNSTTVTATFANVHNPSLANKQFYARITTYSDSNGTVEVDFGSVAVSTAAAITVSGTMPESLVFCVGTSGTDCSNITGSAVSLGVFSPVSTNTGTSVMSASTNASFGYAITISGTTLTSGANTIPAMGTQTLNSTGCAVSCTSTVGTSQYGTNVRANTTPSVGANVTGTGTATGSGGYNTVDAFRYFTGDTVASVGAVSKSNLFTNSYMVNVGGDQAAGVYTATMTYICTATF